MTKANDQYALSPLVVLFHHHAPINHLQLQRPQHPDHVFPSNPSVKQSPRGVTHDPDHEGTTEYNTASSRSSPPPQNPDMGGPHLPPPILTSTTSASKPKPTQHQDCPNCRKKKRCGIHATKTIGIRITPGAACALCHRRKKKCQGVDCARWNKAGDGTKPPRLPSNTHLRGTRIDLRQPCVFIQGNGGQDAAPVLPLPGTLATPPTGTPPTGNLATPTLATQPTGIGEITGIAEITGARHSETSIATMTMMTPQPPKSAVSSMSIERVLTSALPSETTAANDSLRRPPCQEHQLPSLANILQTHVPEADDQASPKLRARIDKKSNLTWIFKAIQREIHEPVDRVQWRSVDAAFSDQPAVRACVPLRRALDDQFAAWDDPETFGEVCRAVETIHELWGRLPSDVSLKRLEQLLIRMEINYFLSQGVVCAGAFDRFRALQCEVVPDTLRGVMTWLVLVWCNGVCSLDVPFVESPSYWSTVEIVMKHVLVD